MLERISKWKTRLSEIIYPPPKKKDCIVNLYTLCRNLNIQDCQTPIRNRILRRANMKPELADQIYSQNEDLTESMGLAPDAFLSVIDILLGYADEEDINAVIDSMNRKIERNNALYENEQHLYKIPPAVLKSLIRTLQANPTIESSTIKEFKRTLRKKQLCSLLNPNVFANGGKQYDT